VLAADETTTLDSAHFNGGLVPGDGMPMVFPLSMGHNRGRYFLLDAKQALDLGLTDEATPRERLLPRALELARQFESSARRCSGAMRV
jgi:enoyl-CoA hydratase/carnithine racemase